MSRKSLVSSSYHIFPKGTTVDFLTVLWNRQLSWPVPYPTALDSPPN